MYQDTCKPGLEDRTVEPPARTDVPASLYTAQLIDDACSPTPLYFITEATEGDVWLGLDDRRLWNLTISGRDVAVDTAALRDLLRVLQLPGVRTALLLME